MYPAELKHHSLVCVTAQQEWLICDGMCLGVRDRGTASWLEDHFAVHERVQVVPRASRLHGALVWDLQVFTFGMTLKQGPVIEVRAAGAEAVLQLPGHSRWTAEADEAPGPDHAPAA